jgi:hypothetical protein
MWKRRLFALVTCVSISTGAQASLTENEELWLAAAGPVVTYARSQLLPVDIIVQPQDTPGQAPLAMGFMNGRCKLVMSMRGNPSADATMDSIPPELFKAVAEAIAAHEVAHCWRHARGSWHTLPAGFVDMTPSRFEDKQFAQKVQSMRETRREEGYADLVGLAWTLKHHPDLYTRVHAWFAKTREYQPVPGSHHDTRNWIRLAKDPNTFAARGTPFEQVVGTWERGLTDEDEEDEE